MRLENVALLTSHLGQTGFDHMLSQMNQRMSQLLRPYDPVQTAGVDIFTIMLQSVDTGTAMAVARRLQVMCQLPMAVHGQTVTPVLTGVLVQAGRAGRVPVSELIACGQALLANSPPDRTGRISLHDYAPQRPVPVPASVTSAVRQGQLVAWFQPQICCNTGRVTGFEALARWRHPSRGLLTPHAFMPGMSPADHSAMTEDVLRQALKALRTWNAAGWHVPTVSVNVAQSDLSDPGFADSVLWELDKQDIAPSRLVIEVLESVAPINSSEHVRPNLERLASAGCALDLDDFGTGYAGLEALRQFGVGRIKIDRAFVTDCHKDERQQRMILAILALAERLGIATLAEGVESAEEHAFLAQIGCDQVQGYSIAPPMPVDRCAAFMAERERHLPDMRAMMRRNAG